jgi:hypothetical protein
MIFSSSVLVLLRQKPHDPGPSGLPQLGQPAGRVSSVAELDTAPKADFETAAKVESFLCRSVPWQVGHSDAGEELRTRVSNSLPQETHLNSKMGMAGSLKLFESNKYKYTAEL